jgi:PAS domain S-box-containing protein
MSNGKSKKQPLDSQGSKINNDLESRLQEYTKEIHKNNRMLRMISECGKAIVRENCETGLLHAICRIAVDYGGYRMAWVGMVESDIFKTVRPAAHAGFEKGFIETMHITWDDNAHGQGPIGSAIRTKQNVIAKNIITDPKMSKLREAAEANGYTSIAVIPLKQNDKILGILSIYATDEEAFGAGEVQILIEMSNDIAYGITALRNIEIRKNAELALIKSENQLKEAQRLAHFGCWDWDAVTDTMTWSQEYYSICGLDPKESVSGYKERNKVFTPESQVRLDAAMQQNIATGQPYEIDLELIRTDGEKRWITARSETRRDEYGRLMGLYGTIQDITERKLAEKALHESEAKFRSIFDQSSIGSAVVGLDRRFIRCNKAFCKLLGYSDEELKEKFVEDITYSDDRNISVNEMKTILDGKADSAVYQKRYVRKSGEVVWGEVYLSLVRDESKNPLYFLPLIQDVTYKKTSENSIRNK